MVTYNSKPSGIRRHLSAWNVQESSERPNNATAYRCACASLARCTIQYFYRQNRPLQHGEQLQNHGTHGALKAQTALNLQNTDNRATLMHERSSLLSTGMRNAKCKRQYVDWRRVHIEYVPMSFARARVLHPPQALCTCRRGTYALSLHTSCTDTACTHMQMFPCACLHSGEPPRPRTLMPYTACRL
jgi:hypothetical protein